MESVHISRIIKSRLPGRCVVILDNDKSIYALIDTIYKLNLDKGKPISNEQIFQIEKELKLSKLKTYAMKLCEGFSRSEYQIRQKLALKEYPKDEIDSSIARLKELGLIDDKKFSQNFVNFSIKKKWGLNKIIRELNEKRVDFNDYKDSISELEGANDFYQNALILAQKKMKLVARKSLDKQKDAIYRHLLSKGYDYEVIKKVNCELLNSKD